MAHAPILPLPETVVAQIKSSTAIVSLSGVVVELLKNALDAQATKIDVTVDFGRGGCCIEDNGLGIAPSEFRKGGGLGRMYCTSKYQSPDVLLGCNGTFLASLGALSLLTITSHHHEYRSHNTLIIHQSKVIDRQLPAPAQQEIRSYAHGTRITVRNLFGNLPVRVKQRAIIAEEKAELDRLYEGLRRETVGLLLGWGQPASLKIRDPNSKVILSFNPQTFTTRTSPGKETGTPRSTHLQFLLNILTQTSYISFTDRKSWVPVAASTSSISIRGAISFDPAPSKNVQFISFGCRPLSSEAGHNELYTEVNRIFSLSSFGTAEEEQVLDEKEKFRRESDRRYKKDGLTLRQLKGARKGVDRWPMFHLRITLKDGHQSRISQDRYLEDETNLQSIIEVLDAMLFQWLTVHHFRPRQRRPKVKFKDSKTSSGTGTEKTPNSRQSEGEQNTSTTHRDVIPLDSPARTNELTRKRKRRASSQPTDEGVQLKAHAFATWTRIKSANPGFFSRTERSEKRRADASTGFDFTSCSKEVGETLSEQVRDVFGDDLPKAVQEGSRGGSEPAPCCGGATHDDTATWTDPVTKQIFLVNARTGCVMPHVPKRLSSHPGISNLNTLTDFNKRLSLQQKKRLFRSDGTSTPWLDDVLQNWQNPVFPPAERSIQRIFLDEGAGEWNFRDQPATSRGYGSSTAQELKEGTILKEGKLSKACLQDAQVIAQLDKKFILVKMRDSSVAEDATVESQLLVLIDQHAADERIRVESLLDELCRPLPSGSASATHRSKLGHESMVDYVVLEKPIHFSISEQESRLFVTHAAHFAAWGILYDISTPRKSPLSTRTGAEGSDSTLIVSTLSPLVSERLKAEPKLLISLLRSEVWKFAENHLPPLPMASSNSAESEGSASSAPLWPQRLSTCPEGLLDLINSRACRSAIMFNDELTMEQCRELVSNLAKCVFPFKCAHWRPSMVPLVDLGAVGNGEGNGLGDLVGSGWTNLGDGLRGGNELDKSGFVGAWREWTKEGEAEELAD